MARINNSKIRQSERRAAAAKRLETKLKGYYAKSDVPEKLQREIASTGFRLIQMPTYLILQ